MAEEEKDSMGWHVISIIPRNQIQENAFLIRTVLRLCFLVFDFAVYDDDDAPEGARPYTLDPRPLS
eukprot:3679994-Rhodomonas_salina.1